MCGVVAVLSKRTELALEGPRGVVAPIVDVPVLGPIVSIARSSNSYLDDVGRLDVGDFLSLESERSSTTSGDTAFVSCGTTEGCGGAEGAP